jgi:hypothetical protein
VIGQQTGTPDSCRAVLVAAGFERQEVCVEPSASFFSADRLEHVFDSALKNPLYGISRNDVGHVNDLDDEYMKDAHPHLFEQISLLK